MSESPIISRSSPSLTPSPPPSSSPSPTPASTTRPHNTSSVSNHSSQSCKTVLNANTEDELECKGFRRNLFKTFFTHLVSICLLGVPYLVFYWRPSWKLKWHKTLCPLSVADAVLLTDPEGLEYVEMVTAVRVTDEFPDEYSSDSEDSSGQENDRSDPAATLLLPERPKYLRYFLHRHIRYVWTTSQQSFAKLTGYDENVPAHAFHTKFNGLSSEEQEYKQILHGFNKVEVEVKSYPKLMIEEVLNPFYVFQIMSIILWSFDEYLNYAACILAISLFSIAITLFETRRQSQNLHDMVASSNDLQVTVSRGNSLYEDISSTKLVPGDVIIIPQNGCLMACDAVLISGTCIVNESMLTGESVPVTKPSLTHDSDEIYDPETHKRHTLFAGTTVIQTRYYGHFQVKAVVVRTGFSTSKGELIRSILFPKPLGFKFYKDSMKFICVLASFAFCGMIYTTALYVIRGQSIRVTILRALDIITVVVPPALPAAMTVGIYYAQSRLKKKQIFCISPQRINMCGKLKLVCFDKTGTLTEDGLDMWGVVESSGKALQQPVKEMSDLKDENYLKMCLASCHSLTLIDHNLIGDPLDIKMFESTNWILEEAEHKPDAQKFDMLTPSVVKPATDKASSVSLLEKYQDSTDAMPLEIGIIRQFTFSSSVARMSVITRRLGETHFDIYTKGAPEKIIGLCKPESIPENFHEQLRSYTLRGFRVIGLAHKKLPEDMTWHKVQRIKRDQVEQDLSFLGLLIMQNTLKTETTPVIKELKCADIRCVMVTGDNLLTAISVARDCRMVAPTDKIMIVEAFPPENGRVAKIEYSLTEAPESVEVLNTNGASINEYIDLESGLDQADFHFAMSGKTWSIVRTHFRSLLPRLIVKGTVFARMAPEQKAQLVEEYQDLDYIVSMCGDGANDCGALKGGSSQKPS